MKALKRTRIGDFKIEDAGKFISLENALEFISNKVNIPKNILSEHNEKDSTEKILKDYSYDKKSNNKRIGNKEIDNKGIDNREIDNRRSNNKGIDNKEIDNKKSNNKEIDNKKTNSKGINLKENDYKKIINGAKIRVNNMGELMDVKKSKIHNKEVLINLYYNGEFIGIGQIEDSFLKRKIIVK